MACLICRAPQRSAFFEALVEDARNSDRREIKKAFASPCGGCALNIGIGMPPGEIDAAPALERYSFRRPISP
jgi:hypothetical protein